MRNKMYVELAAFAGALALAASSIALTAGGAGATVNASSSAITNGPIHYSDSVGQYKTVNADGTPGTKPSFATEMPFYSHDYTKVAWVQRTMGATANIKVYVANADGSNSKKILDVNTLYNFLKAQFSADKSTLFIMDNTEHDIYALDTGTENQTLASPIINRSTANNTSLLDFSVSSTNKIATVERNPNGCSTSEGVVIYDLDGTNADTIETTCTPQNGADAKDSKTVLWNSEGSALIVGQQLFSTSTFRLAVVQLDGTTTPLVTLSSNSKSIALSPDGAKIAFGTLSGTTLTIAVVNVDGSGTPVNIASGPGMFQFLSWAPLTTSSGSGSTESGSTDSGSNTTNNTTADNSTITEKVVPGVTVTDTNIYTIAPKEVASNSAITVLTTRQTKTQKLVSNTPSVCLPSKDDIVFIDEGRCSVSILSKKTNRVLRRFRTTVVEDTVSELKVGNEVAILAPIYFDGGTTDVTSKGMQRIRSIKEQISAAGTVLVVGHSGIALGDTEENRTLSRMRAVSTVKAMKKIGATGPFYASGVGGADPIVTSTRGKDQGKNRRVVIILVP